MQVFISYKSEYRDVARKVKEVIESKGFSTWFDQDDIPKGGYFRHEIQKGLESSDVVLGIVTAEALASREVQAEWDFAYNGSCKLLLFLAQKVDLPYHLRAVQYIDASINPERAIQQLEHSLLTDPQTASPTLEKTAVASPVTETKQTDNRLAMLDKVQEFWVEGVLHKVLGESGSLTINMASSPGAVFKHRDYGDYQFPENSLDVHQLFQDMQRELLILGAPGSGKTILLLQLAEKLIVEARDNPEMPLPVVFNLSSWATKRQSLREWLLDELSTKYQIPGKIGKQWIDHERLLLLLDGLDEVIEEHRAECLSVINAFRREFRSVDMAICSRIAEYEALTSKLDLQGAITLQALSDEQIQNYLSDSAYDTLRETITEDATLRDIAEIPFLLNTMAHAYRNVNPSALVLADGEKRTDHLLERYVEKRIQEDRSERVYTPGQSRRYLSWLAQTMLNRGETTFVIESIVPQMVKGLRWRFTYRLLMMIVVGLLLTPGLILILAMVVDLNAGLLFGTVAGLSAGLVAGLVPLVGKTFISRYYRWSPKFALIAGIVTFPLVVLLVGVLFYIVGTVSLASIESTGEASKNLLAIVSAVAIQYGSGLALIAAPFLIIAGGLRPTEIISTSSPNQGFSRLLRFIGLMILFTAVYGIVIYPLTTILPDDGISRIALTIFIPLSWVFFPIMLIPHMITRIVLSQQGHIPGWRYDKFLDHCATDLHILRKVGGSYIFRHRYLLEYFAGRDLK